MSAPFPRFQKRLWSRWRRPRGTGWPKGRNPSLLGLIALLVAGPAGAAPPPLARIQVIPLPGVEGRLDHLALDAAGKRLFVAALGNDTVEVVDLAAGRRVRTLTGLHEPQGVAFAPGRLFVANGQSGTCVVYDGATLQARATLSLGEDADNARYDPAENRVDVGYGAGALGILDAASGKRLGSVRLPGHPESFQLEQRGPRLFVNVPDAGQIVVIDRVRPAILAAWPVTAARANFPMALDEAGHRLFVGCRAPARLLVYDTRTGQVQASLPIVGDTDDVFYDAARRRVYVTGGDGFLEVFAGDGPDRYRRLLRSPTAPGARTSFFAPSLSRLYVAVPHRGNQAAALLVYAATP